uniref:Uncharacterized protein n=1 Tax=Plectus sambesii TaxID=2011161 RepID=A0A914WQN5_9BILA
MNCYILALILVVQASVISAQVLACPNKWMTPDTTGTYNSTGVGDACQSSMLNSCRGGPNGVCVYSFKSYSYRCCYDVWSGLTAATDLTKASDEGWAKPLCPYGAKGFGSSGTQVRLCSLNSTAASARCPADYTCTRSVNQPPKPALDLAKQAATPCKTATCQAYLTPTLCCLTSTLTGNNQKSFALQGLTPNIVPVAPNGVIHELVFGTAAPIAVVRQGDDWSSQKSLFLTAYTPLSTSTTVTGVAATAGDIYLSGTYKLGATDKFHVLIFDATTNKDILFWNYDLGGTAAVAATPATTAAAEIPATPFKVKMTATASSVTPVAGVSTYTATYVGPASFTPQYPTKHLHVALVFQTSNTLALSIPTFINTAIGTLAPTSVKGNFTTVTAFLKSTEGKALGAPIAGTYFYL